MMDRTRLAVMLFFFCSILLGAAGAQGCNMYIRHNTQHAAADADHQLLLQLTPIVNQLLQIEQQRQQALQQVPR